MRLLRAKELKGRHLHLQKQVSPLRYDVLRGNLMVARIRVSLERIGQSCAGLNFSNVRFEKWRNWQKEKKYNVYHNTHNGKNLHSHGWLVFLVFV
jgi:hypothetical protein